MRIRRRIGAALVATVLGLVGAVALSSPAQASDWGPYKLVQATSGLCLEVPNGSMVFGEQLTLGVCGPTPTWYQEFWFTDAASYNYHYFLRPGHNLWCLRPGSLATFNSTIIQWACDPNDAAEVWWLTPANGVDDPPNTYHLSSSKGYYLTDTFASVGSYVTQGGLHHAPERPYEDWRLIHL